MGAIHEFKPKGRRVNRPGWTHYIPDLRGLEGLATTHGNLIIQIVIDRDSKRHPNGKSYMDRFGVRRQKLNEILDALGLAIKKCGSAQSVWVDVHGWYPELCRDNPTMIDAANRKRTENEPKAILYIQKVLKKKEERVNPPVVPHRGMLGIQI